MQIIAPCIICTSTIHGGRTKKRLFHLIPTDDRGNEMVFKRITLCPLWFQFFAAYTTVSEHWNNTKLELTH